MARFGINDWLSGTRQADGGYSLTAGAVAAAPAAITAGTAYDGSPYDSTEMQIYNLTGGDTIAVTRSVDGTNYAPVNWIDQGFATGSASPFTIGADGIYSFPGGGYLKWTKTGSAGTPTVTVRAGS